MPRGLLNFQKAYFETKNYFGFPEIPPYTEKIVIETCIDFDTSRRYRTNSRKKFDCIHFYIDDFKFESLWNYPERYIKPFSDFKVCIGTDFSLYYDFPVALQIYNKFRNHWLSSYFAVKGVNVIPNISVSTPDCWDWSFLGYPSNSVLAFSNIGSNRESICKSILNKSYEEMIKRLDPIQILYFTRNKNNAPSECTVVELPFINGGEKNG